MAKHKTPRNEQKPPAAASPPVPASEPAPAAPASFRPHQLVVHRETGLFGYVEHVVNERVFTLQPLAYVNGRGEFSRVGDPAVPCDQAAASFRPY